MHSGVTPKSWILAFPRDTNLGDCGTEWEPTIPLTKTHPTANSRSHYAMDSFYSKSSPAAGNLPIHKRLQLGYLDLSRAGPGALNTWANIWLLIHILSLVVRNSILNLATVLLFVNIENTST
jgi:hypothetical protein